MKYKLFYRWYKPNVAGQKEKYFEVWQDTSCYLIPTIEVRTDLLNLSFLFWRMSYRKYIVPDSGDCRALANS